MTDNKEPRRCAARCCEGLMFVPKHRNQKYHSEECRLDSITARRATWEEGRAARSALALRVLTYMERNCPNALREIVLKMPAGRKEP